jgi:hypothetical protein
MATGIYAIANFGTMRLYVGEVRHLKTRWPKMVAQLEQGSFPDPDIQHEWKNCLGDRRFTFHTAEQIQTDVKLRGRKLFLKDCQKP